MPKRTVVEIGCDSFDQRDLQSLNDCRFVFLGLVTRFLGIWGRVIKQFGRFPKIYFQEYITRPSFFKRKLES